MSWKEEIVKDFKQLVSFDSVSFHERKTADWLIERLKKMGFTVTEDNAGSFYGGDTGNIYASYEGNADLEPVIFCAHMDVVEPGCGKKAIEAADGKIHSDENTVLGADDISGILEILYGVQLVLSSGKPHGKIEILFTIGEELYVKGSDVFDYSKVEAKQAYVLDLSGPVGSAANRAPSIISIETTVKGKAAHAGFEPERGIHAIGVAAKAVSRLDMGHVDEETTFNIGTITGGMATNIVPESCTVTGEIRSYNHEKALEYVKKTEEIFAEEADKAGAKAELVHKIHLKAYETPKESRAVLKFKTACKKLGLPGEITSTFGGSDNNSFAKNGIDGLVLSCGMYQVHSTKEYTTKADLYNGAILISELIFA